jgi:para-nitrobenzyl esterase
MMTRTTSASLILEARAKAPSVSLFVAVILVLIAGTTMAQVEGSGSPGPIVKIAGGAVRGTTADGVVSFKGIPYAAPPVGDLRWREPMPVKAWQGVREANSFGPPCIQEIAAFNQEEGHGGKEDCLYLNVWTSDWPSKAPKAVMVWIYGGANAGGASSVGYQNGAALSRKGVIVVSLNFRTGAFGFFAHPGLTAESPHHASGNQGLMDLLAVLKWVHDNIAQFGGDPSRVTLFGQSSGGMDTAYLVGNPMSKGLIHRAIQESGPPVRVYESRDSAEQKGLKLADSVKAPSDPKAAVEFLRSLSGPDLEKAFNQLYPGGGEKAAVTEIDGYMITENTALEFKEGKDLPIPMIVGNNQREQVHSYAPEVTRSWIKANYASFTPQAEEFYGMSNGGTGKDDPVFGPVGTQITADTRQRCPAIAESLWRTSHKHVTYEYQFDPPVAGEPATRHAAEVAFVFGNLRPTGTMGGPYTANDRKISDTVQSYWTNFAKTGDPNGKGLPVWPMFNANARPYLEFTLHEGPVVRENLRRNICDMYIEALKVTIPSGTVAGYPE